jgi:hypothetical protein
MLYSIQSTQGGGIKMKLLTIVALFFVLLTKANAYNVIIDFEELPIDGDTTPGPDPIETKGFNFSGLTEKGITVWPLGAVDDSKVLHWCGIEDNGFCPGGDSIYMTQDDSVVFDLQSLELAMSTTPVDIQLIGLVAGGGIISTLYL